MCIYIYTHTKVLLDLVFAISLKKFPFLSPTNRSFLFFDGSDSRKIRVEEAILPPPHSVETTVENGQIRRSRDIDDLSPR